MAVVAALALVGVQSAQTAQFVGRPSVARQIIDVVTGSAGAEAASTATSGGPFTAGLGAKTNRQVSPLTNSTSDSQKAAASFGTFGYSQGFQPLELSPSALDKVLRGIKLTGATVVRLDLPWQQIQPTSASKYDFSNVLRVYDAATARGLTVLPVTSGVPSWAAKNWSTSSYYNFLLHAGRVLVPRGIKTVEIWNEANLTGLSPADYTKFALIPGAKGFRQAGIEKHKSVTIVSSGLAPAATGGGHYSQLDFLRGIYAAGGRNYFDVAGVHPYTWPDDPTQYTSWNWLQQSKQLRSLMVSKGDSGKQVWATEFGFPTNSGARGVSEAEQAEYVVEGAKLWKSYTWAGLLVFYSYQDLSKKDSDPEHNFGVVREDGAAKPGLSTVRSYIRSK